MNYFRIMPLVLLSSVFLNISFTMENDHKQTLKKTVIATYCGTLIAETLLLVPEIQAFVFGNQSVSPAMMDTVNIYAKAMNLDNITVKTGHSWWHSLVGSIFSNHDTLFIDSSADVHDMRLMLCINDSDIKKALEKNLTFIAAHRDRNIFIAALLIPAFIYGSLGITSLILSKIAPEQETLLAKVKKGFTAFSNNFNLTSLLTLGTIYGFIKAQDYYLTKTLS